MSKIFTEITSEDFAHYAQNHPTSFQQTSEMAALKEANGHELYYLGLKNDQELTFACLVTRTKLRVGYKFLLEDLVLSKNTNDFAIFMPALIDFVKKHQGLYLQVSPILLQTQRLNDGTLEPLNQNYIQAMEELGFSHDVTGPGHASTSSPNWIYIKKLTGLNPENVAESYHKEGRYSIKKAKNFHISLRALTSDELEHFKAITAETSQRLGFPDKDLSYYQELYRIYGDDSRFILAELDIPAYLDSLAAQESKLQDQLKKIEAKLAENPNSKKKNNQHREVSSEIASFVKRQEEAKTWLEEEQRDVVPLACGLYIFHPNETIYLFSGTREKYKHLYAPYLIQDAMIKESLRRKIPLFNFYGISGKFDGSDGVLRFKEAFNGQAVEKMGTFTYITAPYKYRLYTAFKKILNR